MRKVCSDCGTVYGKTPGPDQDTHGFCTPCFKVRMLAEGFDAEFVEAKARELEVA